MKKSYTYPPLPLPLLTVADDNEAWVKKDVIIDVTKPSTIMERTMYIAALHQHYRDPQTQVSGDESVPKGRAPIFTSPPPSGHTRVVVPLDGLRDFVVVGQLYQYAFEGSHRLELYFDGIYVSDVSVLSRLDVAECDACAARQENKLYRPRRHVHPLRLSDQGSGQGRKERRVYLRRGRLRRSKVPRPV